MTAVLVTAGCARQDMNAVPDRGHHAYNPASPATGAAAHQGTAHTSHTPHTAGPGASTAPVKTGGLRPGEQVVTVAAGERLYHIADRHGVELRWLIERNDIVRPIRPGQTLIVSRGTK